jgi:hypothetical protein
MASETVTLPEIIIIGDAAASPTTTSDWWCEGYAFGWNNPNASAERPMPINDELAAHYLMGVEAGRNAHRLSSEEYVGPAAGPDPGGEAYEEAERRWREAWSEFLNHREDPHIEVEPPEIQFSAP